LAWPTVDATTTHLDAGTDDPNLARPQIKLNIENANAIKNEFGSVAITSPTDTQVLAYNGANARWENADATGGGGGGESVVYLGFSGTVDTDGGSFAYYEFTELADSNNLATITGDGELNLATGTYIADLSVMYDTATNVEGDPRWRLRTGVGSGSNVFGPVKFVANEVLSPGNKDTYLWGMHKFTVSSATADYILRFKTDVSANPIDNITDCVVKLIKIS